MNQSYWKIPGKRGDIEITTQDLVIFSELYIRRLAKQSPDLRFDSSFNQVLRHLRLDKETFYLYNHIKKLHRYVIELSRKTQTWIIE